MLKGDYYPDFTAEMMHKDITLGLDLGKKYGVTQHMNEFIAGKYEEAMDKYVTRVYIVFRKWVIRWEMIMNPITVSKDLDAVTVYLFSYKRYGVRTLSRR